MMCTALRSALVVYTVSAFASSVSAADLTAPASDVVLTVDGNIAATNTGDTAQFDMDMLKALPATTINTKTIWTEGEQTFVGVSLSDLTALLEIDGTSMKATAINDYAVDIPASDAVEGGPIIAYELNGAAMSVRDKGPLWVVYPYDAKPEYQAEVIYSRSIWQLDRITVED